MKTCSSYTIEWEESLEDFVKLPDKTLSYTIKNEGLTTVSVDDTVILYPGEAYPVEHHCGYYHTGQIKMRIIDLNETNVDDFKQNTKVLFRIIIENDNYGR